MISLKIANNVVYRVLIDNGSSADILFKQTLDRMNIEGVKTKPVNTPLYGFAGERVEAEGTAILPTTWGEIPEQITKMTEFLIIDSPSAYNAIIGRPSLNSLRMITSTYHLMAKFPTEFGIGRVIGDQAEARKCYKSATKTRSAKAVNVVAKANCVPGGISRLAEPQDEQVWSRDPKPNTPDAVWEAAGNCEKAFWRKYTPPEHHDKPFNTTPTGWGDDFDDGTEKWAMERMTLEQGATTSNPATPTENGAQNT